MKNLKRGTFFTLSVLGVAILLAAFWISSLMLASAREKAEAFIEETMKYKKFAEKVDYVIHYDKLTYWQREKWEPNTFFHTPDGIEACEIISSRDPNKLGSWISGGGDVNLTGDHGVTLLFWALFDRNMTAFELLLIHNADPDVTLTATIERMNERFLYQGDTVMFAAIELKDFDFILTTLPFSNEPDQRDYNGGNLLSRISNTRFLFSVRPSLAAEMIRAGVDPDVWSENYPNVPAANMVSFNRPSVAHAMILAGASPVYGSFADASVVDIVENRRTYERDIIKNTSFQRLESWLIDNGFIQPRIPDPSDTSILSSNAETTTISTELQSADQ